MAERQVVKEVVVAPGSPEYAGYEMKFKGEGNISLKKVRSDLVVRIILERDTALTKKGANLIMVYNLTLAQALKAEPLTFSAFEVGTANRTVHYPVDQIISPQTVIPVEGLGLPVFPPADNQGS